jgi:hypothetical protein
VIHRAESGIHGTESRINGIPPTGTSSHGCVKWLDVVRAVAIDCGDVLSECSECMNRNH